LTAGRQFFVWGVSDLIRVTDVLNPVDWREPGVTDTKDLRLPVGMVRMDYLWKSWSLSGALLPEIRFDRLPVFGSDFYPYSTPQPPEQAPQSGLENAEWGCELKGSFGKAELALYAADIYDDNIYITTDSAALAPTTPQDLVSKHSRLDMYGFSTSVVLKNWVLKTEAAYFSGLNFTNAPGEDYDRIDTLVGTEYYGFRDMFIILEMAHRHILDFDRALEAAPDYAEQDVFQWVFRLEKRLLHDQLKLVLFTSTYGLTGEDGAVQRVTAEYALADAIELKAGAAFYESGDLFRLANIGENDRLFAHIKYQW
jgi:hypothetical protein